MNGAKNGEWKSIMTKQRLFTLENKSTKKADVTFQLGEHEVKKVDKYKYLGVYLNEYLDYQTIANTLSGAAGRVLGSVISKFKSFRNVGFITYSKLYHSGVVSILDYCSGVWGFKKGIPAIRCSRGLWGTS